MDLYNVTAEKLWEKLEANRGRIDASCVNFEKCFPIDQLISGNSFVRDLLHEVEEEHDYQLSEFQCSWAVNQFVRGGPAMMKKYNKINGTTLKAKE